MHFSHFSQSELRFLKLTIDDRQRLCQLSDPALVEMLLRHHNSQSGLKISL